LAGPFSPIDTGQFNYLYAPAFAVLFIPLALLPYTAGAVLWVSGQILAVLAASLLVVRYSGRAIKPLLVFAILSFELFFRPTYHIMSDGNINGLLALFTAIALAGASPSNRLVAVVLAAMTKGVHAALLPLTFWRDGWRHSGRAFLALALLGALSLLLGPGSWLEYPKVLLNLAGGDANQPYNLSPTIILINCLPAAAPFWHLAAWTGALALVLASLYLGRLLGGWPLAVLCGLCGGLLIPSTLYYPWLLIFWPFVVLVLVQPGQPAPLRTAVFAMAVLLSLWEWLSWPALLGCGLLLIWLALLAWGLRPSCQRRLESRTVQDNA
jgi:hypothetical protein